MRKTPPNLGTITVHDGRIGADHQLPITVLELRDGRLHITATGTATLDGSIEPDDITTLRDPAGNTVLRTWLDPVTTIRFNARERVTLMLNVGLGGHRPVVTGDAGLDLDL